MQAISTLAIPIFILIFLISGFLGKADVYDSFTQGVKSGLSATFNIIPSLVGLMVAIAMFRESGCLDLISKALKPLTDLINMPSEIVPLALLRPVSGSAAIAVVTDIFKNFGPDSYIGKMASIMMGSTETTIYTIAVYFGSVGIKNIRYTLLAALCADLCGIIMSVLLTQII